MTGWRLSQLISVSNFNNEWSAWHVITVRCIRRPSDNTKLSAPTSACLNRTRHPALNSVWLNVFLMGVGQPVKEGGVEWRVVYFGKLVFESDEQEFSLRGVYPSLLVRRFSHIYPTFWTIALNNVGGWCYFVVTWLDRLKVSLSFTLRMDQIRPAVPKL